MSVLGSALGCACYGNCLVLGFRVEDFRFKDSGFRV